MAPFHTSSITEETCGQGWQTYLLYVNGVLATTQQQQARSLSINIASKGERDLAVTKKNPQQITTKHR